MKQQWLLALGIILIGGFSYYYQIGQTIHVTQAVDQPLDDDRQQEARLSEERANKKNVNEQDINQENTNEEDTNQKNTNEKNTNQKDTNEQNINENQHIQNNQDKQEITQKIESLTPIASDQKKLASLPATDVVLLPGRETTRRTEVFDGNIRRTTTHKKNNYMIKLVQRQKSIADSGGGALLTKLDYIKLPTQLDGTAFWRDTMPYSLEGIGPDVSPLPIYFDLFVLDELFTTPQSVGTTDYLGKVASEVDMGTSALRVNYLLPVSLEQYIADDYDKTMLDEMDTIMQTLSY